MMSRHSPELKRIREDEEETELEVRAPTVEKVLSRQKAKRLANRARPEAVAARRRVNLNRLARTPFIMPQVRALGLIQPGRYSCRTGFSEFVAERSRMGDARGVRPAAPLAIDVRIKFVRRHSSPDLLTWRKKEP
jgi:hypothetical protein